MTGPRDATVGRGRIRRIAAAAVQGALGPWPLFPGIAAAWLFFIYFAQSFLLALVAPEPVCRIACVTLPDAFAPAIIAVFGTSLQSQVDLPLVFVNSLLAAAAAAGVLWVFRRPESGRGKRSLSRLGYLSVLLLAAIVSALVRVFVANPLISDVPVIGSVVPQTLRTLAALLVIHSLAGILTRRYALIAKVAQDSLAEVERQQRIIVQADERARREVADFLHDRVQAELLVLALDVRRAAEHLPPAQASRLQETITALERIRSEDIRGAGRRLSPDIEAVGLDTALGELAASWREAMTVTVEWAADTHARLVDPGIAPETPRAAYRIVEQALLNSAIHGRADRAEVTLGCQDGTLLLQIADDGRGMGPGQPTRGSGWSVIDAWVSICGGRWSIGTRDSGGAVLRARLPIPAHRAALEAGP